MSIGPLNDALIRAGVAEVQRDAALAVIAELREALGMGGQTAEIRCRAAWAVLNRSAAPKEPLVYCECGHGQNMWHPEGKHDGCTLPNCPCTWFTAAVPTKEASE